MAINPHKELAERVIARSQELNQRDVLVPADQIALAQVHATLAVVAELKELRELLIEEVRV